MSDRDTLGATLTALWAFGNLAATTLLGITVYQQEQPAAPNAATADLDTQPADSAAT
ncbi:hypothetical protein [Streptomyces cinereospinus]|uniref:Uncharacterized protein n=1 Tax=Streptomyces cinereospinus TaxID=285561 RepID=A0ABV5N2Q5_9ACTN